MSMTSLRIVFLLTAGLALAAPASERPDHGVPVATARQEGHDLLLAGYRESVQLLRDGRIREAVQKLLDRGPAWQTSAFQALQSSVKSRNGRFSPADLSAVVLLHLEAFRTPDLLWSDRLSYANHAWALADAAGDALSRDFVRDCHLVVVLSLQSQLAVEEVVVQLGLALQRFPDDPELVLAQGSLWELLAILPDTPYLRLQPSQAIQGIAVSKRGPRGEATFGAQGEATVDVEPPRIYERCARLYEAGLRRVPGHDELRLRLARVLTQAGQFDAAVRAVEPLVGRDPAGLAPELRYLAAMFHGRALQGLGRAGDAVASYRLATGLFPGCQAPQVALSAAVRAAGDQAGAREIMLRMLAASRHIDCAEDPWVRYPEGQTWKLEPLVARLHEAVRQ